jgi:hypothetical protein
MTVDVASSVGDGAVVTGDSVTAQGRYFVPPTAANVNVDIAAADATNPRNDLVVLEVKDDQHDAGGLNLARVRVITGTPNASAAATDAPGANGTPALPVSCMPLAVVRVTAAASSITTAMINDRRPVARPYSRLALATFTNASLTSSTHTTFQDGSNPANVSVTYGASRVLKLTYSSSPYVAGGANNFFMQILRGSTVIVESAWPTEAMSVATSHRQTINHTFNGPINGATETFKVQIKGNPNNTSVSDYGDSTTIRSLLIEDLGPQ